MGEDQMGSQHKAEENSRVSRELALYIGSFFSLGIFSFSFEFGDNPTVLHIWMGKGANAQRQVRMASQGQ
jgi:hypothetical protein